MRASLTLSTLTVLGERCASPSNDLGEMSLADDARTTATAGRFVVAMGACLNIPVTARSASEALQVSDADLQAREIVTARLSTGRDDSRLSCINRLHLGGREVAGGYSVVDPVTDLGSITVWVSTHTPLTVPTGLFSWGQIQGTPGLRGKKASRPSVLFGRRCQQTTCHCAHDLLVARLDHGSRDRHHTLQ